MNIKSKSMKKRCVFSTLFVILLVFSLKSTGQDYSVPTIRVFSGISCDNFMFFGAFNGKGYFVTPDNDIVLIPKVKPGIGAGFHLGFAFNRAEIELAYSQTFHSYTNGDTLVGSGTTGYVRFMHVKGYLGDKRIRPFWTLDFSGAWCSFKDAGFKDISENFAEPLYERTKGIYGGIILGFGGGLSFSINDKLSLVLSVIPEWYKGTDVYIKKGNYYTPEKFSNFLLNNSIGLYYYFKRV